MNCTWSTPWASSRKLRDFLQREGCVVGRKRVVTLMRRMGVEALYRKPNTSRRHRGHTVYPYLLHHLAFTMPNQVWAMGITYIPMTRGFVYIAAVMDWHGRRVLAWRVSNSMESSFCTEAVEEAIARFGARNDLQHGPAHPSLKHLLPVLGYLSTIHGTCSDLP